MSYEDVPPLDAYENEPAAHGMKLNGAHQHTARAATSGNDAAEDVINPLVIEPASAWALRPDPPPRDWIWEELVPAGCVTSLLGNGGLGKTLIALQMAVHVAMSRPLFGRAMQGGTVAGIFCEDDQNELTRRWKAAARAEQIDLEGLDNFYPLSRDGEDNLLCTFDHEHIQLTRFYQELDVTLARLKPRLLFLDTAADIFGGDFMSTPQVRQFIKVALGGLCKRHQCAIVLLAHPSASGMSSGDGGGFSVAWNNSVRSRLYLRRPKSEDVEAIKDRRILEVKKANYGPDSNGVALRWANGCFVLDDEPIEEGQKPGRAAKPHTRLTMATLKLMDEKGSGGVVVPFRVLFETLQKSGEILHGEYQTVRKPLQRVLKQLETEKLVRQSITPRGYRLPEKASAADQGR